MAFLPFFYSIMITPLFQWLPFSGIFMKLPCRIHQLALTKKMQAKIPHFGAGFLH